MEYVFLYIECDLLSMMPNNRVIVVSILRCIYYPTCSRCNIIFRVAGGQRPQFMAAT